MTSAVSCWFAKQSHPCIDTGLNSLFLHLHICHHLRQLFGSRTILPVKYVCVDRLSQARVGLEFSRRRLFDRNGQSQLHVCRPRWGCASGRRMCSRQQDCPSSPIQYHCRWLRRRFCLWPRHALYLDRFRPGPGEYHGVSQAFHVTVERYGFVHVMTSHKKFRFQGSHLRDLVSGYKVRRCSHDFHDAPSLHRVLCPQRMCRSHCPTNLVIRSRQCNRRIQVHGQHPPAMGGAGLGSRGQRKRHFDHRLHLPRLLDGL